MKKIVFSTLLSAIFFAGYSQHTLSFNQAILVSSTQTVPTNAVWKVVALMPSSGAISNTASNVYSVPTVASFAISVNSNSIYFSSAQAGQYLDGNGLAYTYTNASGDGKLPLWLPAGTTLAASTNIQYISVIEFLVN